VAENGLGKARGCYEMAKNSKKNFIPPRNGLRNKKWNEILENGFNNFLDTENNWLYNFNSEAPHPKKQDCEARYLSQMFFSNLIKAIDNSFGMQVAGDRYAYIIKDTQKWLVHFDVMNNPKECHDFGKSIKDFFEEEWKKWNEYYHSIGNLTPIPRPTLGRAANNLQGIHNNKLGERWDNFLKYCQSNWDTWIQDKKYNEGISFEVYMKLTCQLIYYKSVYASFTKKFGNCSIMEISDKELLCDKELLKWYDSVGNIEFNKNEDIITFGEDLKDDVERINRLILLRGRLMMALILRDRREVSLS
jgi:hypothetical protein